jgi:hypothetical protein
MPLMRYFVFVGGALLALLLIANAWLPALPAAQGSRSASAVDLSVIRIHSDTKWPERVVFDTSLPTIAPAVAVAAAQPAQKNAAAEPPRGQQVREAYAQLRPNPSELRKPELKRKRRAVAKNYYAAPPRMLVAQQRPMGFFGNNVW